MCGEAAHDSDKVLTSSPSHSLLSTQRESDQGEDTQFLGVEHLAADAIPSEPAAGPADHTSAVAVELTPDCRLGREHHRLHPLGQPIWVLWRRTFKWQILVLGREEGGPVGQWRASYINTLQIEEWHALKPASMS